MSAQGELWRVSTVEGVFQADLDTLKQWIVEGCVLPTDKVSKGTHGWIEAGRAPMLRGAFNGELGSTIVAVATTDASTQLPPSRSAQPEGARGDAADDEALEIASPVAANLSAVAAEANACHNHADTPAKFICRVCAATFCEQCPRFIGTSKVPLCPLCGDLCRLIGQEREKFERQEFRSTAFGLEDFIRALRYPWQHKVPLLFGAALYGFLLLAGFRGRIIAFVIMFGCIAHVINQVAWGKLDLSFLPDLSAFSMWDDLVVPLGLGIGIAIVTWGPAFALVVALAFNVFNGPSLSPLGAMAPPNEQHSGAVTSEDLSTLTNPNADPRKLAEAQDKLNQTRPGQQISRAAEQSKKDNDPLADLRLISKFIHAPVLLLLLLLLALAWGVFYGPMALAVAGYTEQLGAVLNPLVGLDTIRRMGGTYFKAFGMVISIQIVGGIIGGLVGLILSPFDMPFIGNLPARFVDGSVTFYFNLVIACILGLSLHKCADRLGIDVD